MPELLSPTRRIFPNTKRATPRTKSKVFGCAVVLAVFVSIASACYTLGNCSSATNIRTPAPSSFVLQAPIPKGRYFRADRPPKITGSLGLVARDLASQIEEYSPPRFGIVTETTRRGFWARVKATDGITHGLIGEVVRVKGGLALGAGEVTRALDDPEYLGGQLEGETSHVTRARVTDVGEDSVFFRPADPQRGRRVRVGDIVVVRGIHLRLCVGGISGTLPRPATDALRHILIEELEGRERISAVRGPSEPTGIAWSSKQAAALCSAGSNTGCGFATAGAANLFGDTLHVALGLVNVYSCETVRFVTSSVKADAALRVLTTGDLSGTGQAGGTERPYAEWDLGTCEAYETGLLPSFSVRLGRGALAVHIISEARCLCVADFEAIEIYSIESGERSLTSAGKYEVHYSSPSLPSRAPAGRMARADSDGDGKSELVYWSDRSESPVAFSIEGEKKAGGLRLVPADIYWLPWSEPYGDMRYVTGTNHMIADISAGGFSFYDSRYADLDGDGTVEGIYTDTDGVLRVVDTARKSSRALIDAGAPLEVFDMNRDGRPEIMVTAPSAPGEKGSLLFYNHGPDGARETWRVRELPGGIVSMAAGLLDGDDLPDMVLLLRQGLMADETTLILLLTAQGR